jgi:hypothetical protein
MAVRAKEKIRPPNQFDRTLRRTSKSEPSITAASIASTGDHIVKPAQVIETIEAKSKKIGNLHLRIHGEEVVGSSNRSWIESSSGTESL